MRFKGTREGTIMLKYFIQVTQDFTAMGLILALLYALHRAAGSKLAKRLLTGGALLGVIAAVVMAVMKKTTNKVDTSLWNLRIFMVSIAAMVLLIPFCFGLFRKKHIRLYGVMAGGLSAVLAFTLILYAAPGVMLYPFEFLVNSKESVMSTEFLFKLIGWTAGLLLTFLAAFALNRASAELPLAPIGITLLLMLLCNAVKQVGTIINVLLTKRMIANNHTLFVIAKNISNHSNWFIFAALIFAVIPPVTLWVRSLTVREPYENPAQHRKIKAKWRRGRKWSVSALCYFAAIVVVLTAILAYNSRGYTLSPSEPIDLRGDEIYIPIENVEDGHLHRFTYEASDGKGVRFIVIRKPNSQMYGIGLDACDICGETGYYERDGQVVCKLCDVVMNINTIGFKGGCNPIPIDYSVENGYIIVPTATLEEKSSKFS